MLRIALAVLHLLGLGVGLGAVYARAVALRRAARSGSGSLNRMLTAPVFAADNLWALAALLWVSTGLWRWLAGTEKAREYYLANHVFMAKLGLFALVFLLELYPMVTLIRWRRASAGDAPVGDAATAGRMATISWVQLALVPLIVVAAVLMARGWGAGVA